VEHGRLVVIAGQAQHWHAERAEHAPEMLVARHVILHEVAGDEHRIDGPLAGLREIERAHECGQRGHAAQRAGLTAVEVRIGELYETHDAHFQNSTQVPER
jgi:hypothetical protein